MKNEITYTQHGDYLLPDLKLPVCIPLRKPQLHGV